ncbi:GNAT family N-acetyltransferase [Dinghuibacter silviterrae]|uniref:Ribosomal protein S18 acetylase RimI-like enzyme n=1 Tax=Dinghuibacter silviterrae TaxID=1539049 RepID=A0A4R8DQ14_9BACT|nr:GNAT family N-acetyltransferase [Dinghuibacter silviterrae]TDW99386.1 ribosomal protein S18 acetylase RimI-like enzyme [Dinghuibacter silviterrae]
MALRIIEHGSGDYRQMVELRDEILRRPLGLTFSKEELAAEVKDILVAAFEEEQLVACCLLSPQNKDIVRLRQMAVSSEVQGKGVGKALILFAETVSRDHGFIKITMHARATAVGFYEKMGYKISGPEFVEVTLPHYIMEKPLL